MRVSRGSLESMKINSQNIMLHYYSLHMKMERHRRDTREIKTLRTSEVPKSRT